MRARKTLKYAYLIGQEDRDFQLKYSANSKCSR
jgi:hypothetical protein